MRYPPGSNPSQAGFNQQGSSENCSTVHSKGIKCEKEAEEDTKANLEDVVGPQGRSASRRGAPDYPILKICTNSPDLLSVDERRRGGGEKELFPEKEGDETEGDRTSKRYAGWCIYNGQWVNDRATGSGSFTWGDGRCYEGGWEDGRRKGLGMFYWPASGSRYKGEWKDDKREGFGSMVWGTSGDSYEGQWIADTFEGTGVYKWGKNRTQTSQQGGDVRRYEGEWKKGLRWGHGTMHGVNGHKYIGAWENDETCGLGRCVWIDGREYYGEWKGNRQHGKGKMTWPDGEMYDGEWREGNFHGRGMHVWPDGRKYEGEMRVSTLRNPSLSDSSSSYLYFHKKEGMRWGIGCMFYADGDAYKGSWRDDESHGKGTYTKG